MIKRLIAGALALCALVTASCAFAQTVTAPAVSYIPSTGLAYGAKDAAATFVDGSHPLPVTGTITASDANNAAFSGETAMPALDTAYTAGRSLKAICTVPGIVSVTYADATTGLWSVVVGINPLIPVQVTKINTSGTTATCTYFRMN